MAVSIFDENTPHDGTTFTPFDESKAGQIQRAALASSITNKKGINTAQIDEFRQGIEISAQTHRFKGLGAKIWSGNIKGYTKIDTVGQTLRFTEYEGTAAWEELPEFNPVSYLELGPYYPLPIMFNEGPQQNEETSIQPLTIPFRKGLNDGIEGSEKYHTIRGNLEDGNQNINYLNGRTNRIQQIKPYESSVVQEPFLDEGQDYFGSTMSGSIVIDNYIWDGEKTIAPFIEKDNDSIVEQLNTTNSDLIELLKSGSMNVNLNDDIRETYGVASATAGSTVYGQNMARYGTDSLAYIGTILGS